MNPTYQLKIPGFSPAQPITLVHITDTHFSPLDADEPNAVRRDALAVRRKDMLGYFGDSYETAAAALFNAEQLAGVDAIVMTGDLIDYPSRAALRMAGDLQSSSNRKVFYIPGNHDWYFTDQKPSPVMRAEQRQLLAPLYHPQQPAPAHAVDFRGIQFLLIDNSTYQIEPDQLQFATAALARDIPTAILLHIPITSPELRVKTIAKWRQPLLMGDEIAPEVRKGWNIAEPRPETAQFIEMVKTSLNVFAVFAGHVHLPNVEKLAEHVTQYVGAPGFEGKSQRFTLV